jgi:hypothetical protein
MIDKRVNDPPAKASALRSDWIREPSLRVLLNVDPESEPQNVDAPADHDFRRRPSA